MRKFLPIVGLVETIQFSIGIADNCPILIEIKILEGNDAYQILVKLEPGQRRSKTKHYIMKMH